MHGVCTAHQVRESTEDQMWDGRKAMQKKGLESMRSPDWMAKIDDLRSGPRGHDAAPRRTATMLQQHGFRGDGEGTVEIRCPTGKAPQVEEAPCHVYAAQIPEITEPVV